MEKYNVLIEPVAEKDLFDIFYYISESLKEPKIAERIYFAIKEKILALEYQPYMYAVVNEEPYYLREPLKTPCEQKRTGHTAYFVNPPRQASSLLSSGFLVFGAPCLFLLFTRVFRGSLKRHKKNSRRKLFSFLLYW